MDYIEEPELEIKVEKDNDWEYGLQSNSEKLDTAGDVESTEAEHEYKCYLCQEKFSTDLEMINHQFLHTNEDFSYDMVLYVNNCVNLFFKF